MRGSLLASVIVFVALIQPIACWWDCWHIINCGIDCPQSGFPIHDCKCTPASCECCRWIEPGLRRETLQTDAKGVDDRAKE